MSDDLQGAAGLVLKLYELRRDREMRAARDWFTASFFPQSVDDVIAAWTGADSAKYRMVTTYWEMAATLVTHAAIPEAMFNDANTEHVAVFITLQPFLDELRVRARYPSYLAQLERLVTRIPDLEERAAPLRMYLALRRAKQQGAAPPPLEE